MVRIWGHFRAQLVGYVALFVALGGTAWAALPANSVGTKQLQNGAVTGVKVATHTLTGANIDLSKLGTVPNAAHLGGLLPKAFQRLVSGSCLGHGAIAKISANGSVGCQPTGTGTISGVSGAAGSGITGGGSSGSVTLGIDPSVIQHRLTGGCSSGQALTGVGQDGSPSCQPFGSGDGTITSVSAGTGLSGGGSSGGVSLALASGYQLPQSCSTGQLTSWSGSAWGCENDLGSTSWQLGGNAGTNPASDYLGTSDSQPLKLAVNGQQALQLQPNSTSPNLIGGYSGNNVTSGVFGATIAGGGQSLDANTVTDDYGTVSGGLENTAGNAGTVAGGQHNTASGGFSFAAEQSNTASGNDSTALGDANTASGNYSTTLGLSNTASGITSTALGAGNTASGTGSSTLGISNTASGTDSVALGAEADIPSGDNTSFVWSDGTLGASNQKFSATGAKQFDALASNGFTFQNSAPGATFVGCTLTTGSWSCTSDRNAKHAFRPVSDQAILQALARMPIESWSYKIDRSGTRHIGPTAQDFLAAFHVGNNPREIGMLDEGGVALAAIKGLYGLVQRQQATINHQQAEINWLMAHMPAR